MAGNLSLIPGITMLLTCVSGALAVPMLLEAIDSLSRRALGKQRVMDDHQRGSLSRDLIRNGLPWLKLPVRVLVKIKPWADASRRINSYLLSAGYHADVEGVSELLLAASLGTAVAVSLLTGQPMVGVTAGILLIVSADSFSARRLRLESQSMREQLPDALQCLGFCFMAGCSLEQAIEQTVAETPEPLRRELQQTSNDLQSGIGIKESLAALEERNNLPELSFLAVALEIQHQTGGSLKDLLESAAESVRTAVRLRQQLQVQTAQARLSFKVVALMPVVLVSVLSLGLEGYLASFFSSTEGFMILLVACLMEALGIIMIRRILGVDLG